MFVAMLQVDCELLRSFYGLPPWQLQGSVRHTCTPLTSVDVVELGIRRVRFTKARWTVGSIMQESQPADLVVFASHVNCFSCPRC